MKSSPIKPNKFITHLSDDILNENHHLKAEIIKMRKTLKSIIVFTQIINNK
jgi:hypothetical protein